MAGRTLDAAMDLLDRQLVDADGKLVGKVDDLELTLSEEPGQPPYVSAILTGPGALAARLSGRPGGWLESLANRLLNRADSDPPRIPFGVVKRIHSSVDLSIRAADLESLRLQRWLRGRVVSHLPGARDAPE